MASEKKLPTIGKDSKLNKKRKIGNQLIWYIFLLPCLLGILLFLTYPIIESFRLSFFKSNGTIETFTGIRNFKYILSSGTFWNSVWNTFYIGFFQIVIAIPLGYIFATLINTSKGSNLFKVIYFLPNITPLVAAAMIFTFVLHPGSGIMNFSLESLGLPTPAWFSDPSTSKWGIVLLSSWHWLGFVIIISLANLQAISPQLYESAKIDGANAFQRWLYITTPNMGPTFTFLIITGWIGAIQRFNEVYVIGGSSGSPSRSLQTMGSYIYDKAFKGFEFGLASTATFIMFIIILVFTLINIKITRLKI